MIFGYWCSVIDPFKGKRALQMIGCWTGGLQMCESFRRATCALCQVSTVEAAALQVVIGDGLTCAEPGAGNLTGIFAAEATGDNGEWGVTTVSAISIPAGTHSLKLCVTGGVGLSVDSVTFTNVSGQNFRSINVGRRSCGSAAGSVGVFRTMFSLDSFSCNLSLLVFASCMNVHHTMRGDDEGRPSPIPHAPFGLGANAIFPMYRLGLSSVFDNRYANGTGNV